MIPVVTQAGRLSVMVYPNRQQLGIAAAMQCAERISHLLEEQLYVNIIFAAAPSQNEFLLALAAEKDIDWQRVNAFHMDEYVGLPATAPQGFGNFLKERLFDRLPFREVHYINGNAPDAEAACFRYAALLKKYPVDIVNMGIGENTHIAFNDPHVADFNDPLAVKVVDLDLACRQQQVNDGCFTALEEVPTHAITLTVPSLMRAKYIYCMVPGANKAAAVNHTLHAAISEQYPSTILRTHPHAILFADVNSAG
ncbi:glucosamine-6-phosphate deaminase [Chitinophaga sp.]|uniref:glucosamine-6-phosphate deaminase n=1 Tax=Chitinophaga sp. TaxID=1869181 RepID=UPI002F932E80